jgi:hypothetical protein
MGGGGVWFGGQNGGAKGSGSIGTGARRGDGGPTLEQQARVSVGDATSAGEGHMCVGGEGSGWAGPSGNEGGERERRNGADMWVPQ